MGKLNKKMQIRVLPEESVFEPPGKETFFNLYRKSFGAKLNVKKLIYHLVWLFRGIQVFALVGKSGTGKSFRAKLVAQKYNIDVIIDDGLVIKDKKIIAGKSAKKEKSMVEAIKTALFLDENHLQNVLSALEKENFKRVLIIATSEKMVNKITERLGLPYPKKIIRIEDIASQKEIEEAKKSRELEGKHVIPVPAVEVRTNYPHIFFQSIKILFERKIFKRKKQNVYEKSIVRPAFSSKGEITISDKAVSQMVFQCVKEFDDRLKVDRVIVERQKNGYRFVIMLEVPYGIRVAGTMQDLQNYIIENMDKFAGVSVNEVNIRIEKFRKTTG